MDWLARLLPSRRTEDEERRAQETQQTLALMDDFKRDLRRDIDRRKLELRFPLDSVRVERDDT